MPRYIIEQDFIIRAQSGDDFDVTFHVPEVFPILTGDIASFVISEAQSGAVKIQKNFTAVSAYQTIAFSFDDSETVNLSGKFRWTLRINRNNVKTRIGQGVFELK